MTHHSTWASVTKRAHRPPHLGTCSNTFIVHTSEDELISLCWRMCEKNRWFMELKELLKATNIYSSPIAIIPASHSSSLWFYPQISRHVLSTICLAPSQIKRTYEGRQWRRSQWNGPRREVLHPLTWVTAYTRALIQLPFNTRTYKSLSLDSDIGTFNRIVSDRNRLIASCMDTTLEASYN